VNSGYFFANLNSGCYIYLGFVADFCQKFAVDSTEGPALHQNILLKYLSP
jgi:hypothetical protein